MIFEAIYLCAVNSERITKHYGGRLAQSEGLSNGLVARRMVSGGKVVNGTFVVAV